MKIGILTFHIAHNYGAVLQALGMQEYLRSMGHDAFIIDYRPRYKVNSYKVFNWRYWASKNPIKCVQRLVNEIRIKHIRYKRWKGFDNFISKRLRLYSLREKYDVVILGSDQIWSPALTGGKYDATYFGNNIEAKKILSYAASSRHYNLSMHEINFLKYNLSRIEYISVREDELRKILSGITNRPITTVLDPTFIAGAAIYNRYAEKPKEKDYILIYEITRHKETYEFAKQLAEKLNVGIVELVAQPMKATEVVNPCATPEQFLGYIRDSKYVVTTSFHGLAFSIIFRKPFYAVRQNTDADIRLENLLNQIDSIDRLVEMGTIPEITYPNYNKIETYLNDRILESRKFLTNAIID